MEDNNTYSNEKLLIKIQEEPLSGKYVELFTVKYCNCLFEINSWWTKSKITHKEVVKKILQQNQFLKIMELQFTPLIRFLTWWITFLCAYKTYFFAKINMLIKLLGWN